MNFRTKCEDWYEALPTARRDEARRTRGVIPDWMVISLEEAGIAVVQAAIVDGRPRQGFLMVTALRAFLDQLGELGELDAAAAD